MEAWQRLAHVTLKPWERRAILAMDAAYRETWAEVTKEDEEGGEALTPDLLVKIAAGRSVATPIRR